jgi:hypothetical protein
MVDVERVNAAEPPCSPADLEDQLSQNDSRTTVENPDSGRLVRPPASDLRPQVTCGSWDRPWSM